ncbi:hypothetical protein EWS92_23465 [Vibrio vulnificus]|uniref:hypothetical protein n=1 Tax=Vibrio vulnificus TaxID=672 RepID=UPI00076AF230|nr:hypothetical protein [Vibrio vulnificus]EGQ7859464.1 hypothetical protein [Vibrio parahaemolyticus]AMG12246.1 hypothetical protein AL549_12985 [Vibrio vulnificus]EGR0059105.1 hypothetical protein [Vibrio vulnificus]EGR0791330.1 hypothetical protein [Vibrio vulnificus]EGR0799921.1 hypothetical protein [Vibrio vulnificus]
MNLDELEKQLMAVSDGLDKYVSTYTELEHFYYNKDSINKVLELNLTKSNHEFLERTRDVMSQVEAHLTSIYDELEERQKSLTEQYAFAKFSLAKGDFVDYVDFNGKQCALRINSIDYSKDKHVNVSGLKLIKSGKVGKMHGFFSTKTNRWEKRTEL